MNLNTDEKQAAEYAMALDLLSKITQSDTEDNTVENILEIFTILFASKKLSYFSLSHGQSLKKHSQPLSDEDESEIKKFAATTGEKYAWMISGNGFMIKINHKDTLLGIMAVDDIGYPEYKARYLNLSMSIVDVCGLAIENAKRFERLKNSEYRLRKEKEKLEAALTKVKKLSGLLPICANCKKIRDDKGYWKQIEAYIQEHSEAEFTHGICKECAKELYPDMGLYDD
jgi:hypothetical protein